MWPHLNQEILAHLEPGLPACLSFFDHVLNTTFVKCEQDITDPFFVKTQPVFLIWEVLEQGRLSPCILQEVFAGEAFNLGYCSKFDQVSLNILQPWVKTNLPLWCLWPLACRSKRWHYRSWAGKPCSLGIGSRKAHFCNEIAPSAPCTFTRVSPSCWALGFILDLI